MNNNHILFIITNNKFLDSFRTTITNDGSLAVLFNPEKHNDYCLTKNSLCYSNGKKISDEDFIKLLSSKNTPIKNQLLINAIFSFIYFNFDVRNFWVYKIDKASLNRYLGLSIGAKGYNLYEKIASLSNIYGIIFNLGVFPLLKIKEQTNKIIVIESHYFHQLALLVLENSYNSYGEAAKFYSDKVNLSILKEKNKNAAMIAIELISLSSRCKANAHIKLKTLIYRVPNLLQVCQSTTESTSLKNRTLKRAFKDVKNILDKCTKLQDEVENFNITFPEIKMNNLDACIEINFKYTKNINKKRRELN